MQVFISIVTVAVMQDT